MFGIENFWLFLAAALLLNVTPGPDMIYVATRSAAQGRSAGIVSALAIGAGCLFHITAAALGLSAVLMYSAVAFAVVKWAGAAYLVYMGVRALLESRSGTQLDRAEPQPLAKVFRQGVLINVLNPKVALFFLAFLPQFADQASPQFTAQIVFMGATFCCTGTLTLILVALCFGAANSWLKGRKAQQAQGLVSGTSFIALGAYLGLAES